MLSQSTTVRTWVFMGMAMFYVLFLLTVMKFFEASEPRVMASKRPVESLVVTDHDVLADIKPVAERQMSSHVVRVSHSPLNSLLEDPDYWTLLRREFDKDDSKMSDILATASGSSPYHTEIRPRLRPVLKGDGLRSLLGWARTIRPNNKKRQQQQRRSTRRQETVLHFVSSEWVTSRVR